MKLGVLLQPKIVEVSGGSYDIESIGDDESFEVLNNHTRNAAILNALNDMGDKLTKGIVYVGTAQHARDLFAAIRKSSWASRFHTLALVLGTERNRILTQAGQEFAQEPRRDFMQALKSAPSALIVNVDVLTEGFDDPGVNTVVMARPTRSKLVYMQAIGRAVRLNAGDLSKQAYIVEVVDDLPNIRYRIDNRWLYSDVSDLLEPSVEDRFYSSSSQLEEMIQRIFVEFNVPQAARGFPVLEEHDRVSMLLFKVYRGAGKDYEHVPLVITNANRVRASNFFNFLSMRMKTLRGSDIETAIKPVLPDIAQFAAGAERQGRKRLFYAMQNAFELVNMPSETPESIRDAQPWITFIAFRFELPVGDLSDDLRKFTDDMSNRDWVRETLRADAVSAEFALAKMPLPLSGFVGVFLAPGEMTSITDTVEKLRSHSSVQDGVLQWTQTKLTIGTAALPVESRFVDALPTIVREDLDYFRWLNPRNKGEI